MATHVHAVTNTGKMPTDRPFEEIDQSLIVINTLKEEIGRFQEVLLYRLMSLEEKCNVVHEQRAAVRWMIETPIVLCVSTVLGLLVDVCEQLATGSFVKSTNKQKTKIQRLRRPPTASQVPLSPTLLSSGFFTVHRKQIHQQPSSFASSQ